MKYDIKRKEKKLRDHYDVEVQTPIGRVTGELTRREDEVEVLLMCTLDYQRSHKTRPDGEEVLEFEDERLKQNIIYRNTIKENYSDEDILEHALDMLMGYHKRICLKLVCAETERKK